MFQFVLISVLVFLSHAQAQDTMYYACVGDDSEYQVAALQQVITRDGDRLTSTFVLDLASSTDEYMTRYNQKDKITFVSSPLDEERAIVLGKFEKDEKVVGMTIFYFWRQGHRMELSVDGRVMTMPCKKTF